MTHLSKTESNASTSRHSQANGYPNYHPYANRKSIVKLNIHSSLIQLKPMLELGINSGLGVVNELVTTTPNFYLTNELIQPSEDLNKTANITQRRKIFKKSSVKSQKNEDYWENTESGEDEITLNRLRRERSSSGNRSTSCEDDETLTKNKVKQHTKKKSYQLKHRLSTKSSNNANSTKENMSVIRVKSFGEAEYNSKRSKSTVVEVKNCEESKVKRSLSLKNDNLNGINDVYLSKTDEVTQDKTNESKFNKFISKVYTSTDKSVNSGINSNICLISKVNYTPNGVTQNNSRIPLNPITASNVQFNLKKNPKSTNSRNSLMSNSSSSISSTASIIASIQRTKPSEIVKSMDDNNNNNHENLNKKTKSNFLLSSSSSSSSNNLASKSQQSTSSISNEPVEITWSVSNIRKQFERNRSTNDELSESSRNSGSTSRSKNNQLNQQSTSSSHNFYQDINGNPTTYI